MDTKEPGQSLLPTEPIARSSATGGIILTALGVLFGYWFIYRPLHELQQTGQITYYLKGIMVPPLCVYMGILAFTGRFRDGEIRKLNRQGKPTFTRKGWIAAAGALVVIGLTFAAWSWYLHALGVERVF